MIRILLVLSMLLATVENLSMNQDKRQPQEPATAMRELRKRMLAIRPAEIGITAGEQCPRVFGILIDWPVDDQTVSVVSFCDGNASLYSTSTFGIMGGFAHESVRRAAADLVKNAEKFYPEAQLTQDHSYPKANRVRFYLLTFEGLRVLEDDRARVEADRSRYSALFEGGQKVITQLRLVASKRE